METKYENESSQAATFNSPSSAEATPTVQLQTKEPQPDLNIKFSSDVAPEASMVLADEAVPQNDMGSETATQSTPTPAPQTTKESQNKSHKPITVDSVEKSTNHYDTLGVNQNASAEEIRKAYKDNVRSIHPDKSDHPNATEMFKKFNEAYEVLSDPGTRANYDQHLAQGNNTNSSANTSSGTDYQGSNANSSAENDSDNDASSESTEDDNRPTPSNSANTSSDNKSGKNSYMDDFVTIFQMGHRTESNSEAQLDSLDLLQILINLLIRALLNDTLNQGFSPSQSTQASSPRQTQGTQLQQEDSPTESQNLLADEETNPFANMGSLLLEDSHSNPMLMIEDGSMDLLTDSSSQGSENLELPADVANNALCY